MAVLSLAIYGFSIYDPGRGSNNTGWVGVADKTVWVGVADKTVWDWLGLLIVPAVLGAGGLLFTLSQNYSAQKAENMRRQYEAQIAENRSQDEALQAYLDQMGRLLLDADRPLRQSEVDSEVRTLARARTLAVLSRLDGSRKGTVVKFLYESGLISDEGAIVDLRSADLSGSILDRANLIEAKLSSANLAGAALSHASLSGADLRGANLNSAVLREAILAGTDLGVPEPIARNPGPWGWTDPPGTSLVEAVLVGAILEGANLEGADLSRADLTRASVLHPRAGPSEELQRLAEARDLTLRRDVASNLWLEHKAKSLEDTTMPNGQKYEGWLKNREGHGEDGENSGP